MANPLLDTISDVGYALDTPGALLRGLLAGKPGSRASGTDLLDAYGLPGGPVGGMAAEMVLDPLAIAGPALGAFRGLRGLSHADDAAPLLRRLGELGGSGGGGLDRRLADLAGHADPMDALRAGYRGTVGAPTPAGDALRRFAADEFGGIGTSPAGVERADVLGSGLTEGMRKRPQTGKMTAGEVARFDARAQGDELFNPGMSDDEARYAEVLGGLGRSEPRPDLFDDLTAASRPSPMGGADDAYAGFGREYLDRFGDIGAAMRRFAADDFGGIDLSGFGRGRAPFTPDEVLAATGRRASHLGLDEAKAAYQPWVDSLLPEERSAVKMFTSGPQQRISHALRGGSELAGGQATNPFDDRILSTLPGTVPLRTPDDVMSEVVPYLDSALSRTAAPKDLMTYRLSRRIGDLTPANAMDRVGDVVSDPSYMSTTITPWRRFYGNDPSPNNLLMDILVPGGGKGGYADAISSWGQEKELLLPRDLPMRVADARQVPAFKADYEWHRLDPEGRPIPKLGHSGNALFRDVPDDELEDWLKQGVYGDVRVPDEFLARDWRGRLDRPDLEQGSITNVLLEALGGGPSPHLPAIRRRTPAEVWGEILPRLAPGAPRKRGVELDRVAYERFAKDGLRRDVYPDKDLLSNLRTELGLDVDIAGLLRSIPRTGA